MGKCYVASSLGTPEEMSEVSSERISSNVRKNSLSVTVVGQWEGQRMELNQGSLLRGPRPSRGGHTEEEAEAASHPKAPEELLGSPFSLGCTLTLPSALKIPLLPLPFFLVGVNCQHLPSPGISENMAEPLVPDLLEEKLRSQLEEEKRRCPFFSPCPPCRQPQRTLRDGLELPRTGRAATFQPRPGASLGTGSSS